MTDKIELLILNFNNAMKHLIKDIKQQDIIENLQDEFDKTMKNLLKEINRHDKIMTRSDTRQQKEYDHLQEKLIEVQHLEEEQKKLMDSFIELIAGAIDAKSLYTGKHCKRVPEISVMLAKAASTSEVGIFKDFKMDCEDELRELSISAWLHDCGKVVTPEYVVDKATKLETIYNRIHEVRTRFEVIHRDLTIEAMQKKIDGEDHKEVDSWLDNEHKKLTEDYNIIATSNVGGEFMRSEDQDKVRDIGKRVWVRNFDDTIGLSYEEKMRLESQTPNFPSEEFLLRDRKRDIIERINFDHDDYASYGFKTPVPDDLYNLGEIYNLTVAKGTLTTEERFKIQEHIMMTIKMLEQLPFPEYLKNVPLYAGAHHETLNGSGYPRQLTKEDMPIPARIMAIADVFEALTASDRPYKEAKTLSASIKILSFMVKDQELDEDIFKLFLTSGVYKEYAQHSLLPEQIDDVDISKYL